MNWKKKHVLHSKEHTHRETQTPFVSLKSRLSMWSAILLSIFCIAWKHRINECFSMRRFKCIDNSTKFEFKLANLESKIGQNSKLHQRSQITRWWTVKFFCICFLIWILTTQWTYANLPNHLKMQERHKKPTVISYSQYFACVLWCRAIFLLLCVKTC